MTMGLTQEDGVFYTFGNYTVWKLKIRSENAKSLNFEFSNLTLPAGSRMFIYGMEGRMLHGPVEADKVHDGIYASDIVLGDYAVIDVYLPEGTSELFSINIENAIHGINDALTGIGNPGVSTRAFGDSGSCNINTSCPEGNGWGNQINAVCLILKNNSEHCTGTLIANACNDLTPFILTADHCVTGFASHNWVFRFNYESITCPPTVEPYPGIWISYSGAQLRANSAASDFALLELNNQVSNPEISFAGWNRASAIPPNSTCIHHPRGDVKKISIDDDSPTVSGSFLEVIWNDGTTEPGSSGSALFDDNRRIIGQLFGGSASCDNPTGIDEYGRIFSSWTGGGTNATRLSNWLGDGIDPMTTNAVLIPSIAGSNVVCTTAKTYTLQNPLPGYAVTWSVAPTNLFGSPTSGNGVNASLWAANSFSQGAATITYTVANANCGEQTFTRNIWVGKPLIQTIKTPECFSPGSNYSIQVIAQGATNFNWTFPNCPNGTPTGDPDPACWFNYTGNGPNASIYVYAGQQSGSISVWASNECGTSSRAKEIVFCGGGEPPCNCPIIRSASGDGDEKADEVAGDEPEKVKTYPNPAKGLVTVELDAGTFPVGEPKTLSLVGLNGQPVYASTFTGNKEQISTGGIAPGIYFLKISSGSETVLRKIIIH
jgi:lysyl endopeptidase